MCYTVHTEVPKEKALSIVWSKGPVYRLFGLRAVQSSLVGDPEKEAYFVRNKNPTVIWILNDQNSSKWSIEEC